MGQMTYEQLQKHAEAVWTENRALRREIDEMRGRLREARHGAQYYRAKYQEALKYRFDAETEYERDRTRRREMAVAMALRAGRFLESSSRI